MIILRMSRTGGINGSMFPTVGKVGVPQERYWHLTGLTFMSFSDLPFLRPLVKNNSNVVFGVHSCGLDGEVSGCVRPGCDYP
jgi:hypothetical protein